MFEGKNVKVMLANAGAGKALSVDTIIPTPEGFKRFGDIKVGDYVYNADGKSTMVLGVYPQGKLEAYKVTFSDGRSTICNDEHLWGVYTRTGHSLKEWKYQVMTLKEMLEKGIRGVDTRKNRNYGSPKFYIPASPVCAGEHKNLPVDPYVLGSFIGNGCLTSKYLTLSSNDEWQVKKVADKLKCTYKRNKANYNWTFYRDGHLIKTDSIFPEYLCCKANDKFIPDDYLFASVKQRQELLQGLFDTDGSACSVENRLRVTYSTVSKELALDIRNILLSFGIVSSIRKDKRKDNICYCLNINASKDNKELLFSLPRKKKVITSFTTSVRRDYTKVAIRSVEKLSNRVLMQCIYVGNEKHLFLCNDFIVTHNTHYLVNDITKELESRRPEEVAFVTFTRKGAEEGLHRICDKLMLEVEDLPYFRTLHSLTFHALNLKADQMFGRYDQRVFNKKYGYNINRSEVNTGKVAPTKDSMYLDFYDMERSGALTTKQLVEADIEIGYYRQLVRNYEDFKREQHLVDFFDCLIKYVQTGSSLPCKVLYVDECQDISALQWKVIEKAFDKAEKIILTGDDKQCQPVGSKVLTKEGYKNIEDVRYEDSLITFSMSDYSYYGKRQAEYHPEIAHRLYSGKLIDVNVNGTVNKFTPNHKLIVRWLNRDTSLQCVYLMRKGDWFRVGQCQIFTVTGTTHFISRMNIENADEGWILRICKTKEEALIWEQVYSMNYGIPQISWSKWHTRDMQKTVYDYIPCMESHAELLLKEVGRDINYPMFNHEKNGAKSGGTCISLCEAVNLIPEIMALPVYQGKSRAEKKELWHNFTVTTENYTGYVYSMDVPKYHTYITDGGLTVHNCIFSYSGARPDILIALSKQFPTEHLAMSYRLPRRVFELANAITRFIGVKTEQKSIFREVNAEGSITQLNDIERLTNFIHNWDGKQRDITEWYILARNNCFLDKPKKLLEDNLIPYWTAEGFFMGGQVMKRIKDYEGYRCAGYRDDKKKEDFQRRFGIEDFSLPFTETNLFTENRKWVYASYIEKYGLEKLKEMCTWRPQILVSTVHHVKGGEARNVALMLDTTRRTQMNIQENLDEELHILYVAVTRARENLFLIDSSNGTGFDEVIETVKDENGLVW